jgi:ATP-binding cassette subfamily B protein
VTKYKQIIKDILHVSKVTKTKNKKILIGLSVLLSQVTVLTDVLIISLFAFVISGEIINITQIQNFIIFVFELDFILPFLVIFRFLFMYYQAIILKKIELDVSKNLRIYILKDIIDKRNYSIADSFFYVNTLTTHISFFYSNFAKFLNSFLQIIAYAVYLIITDIEVVTMFSIGIVLIIYPIIYTVKKARLYMHETFVEGQNSTRELQRVVENLFIIKILKMENSEVSKFSNTIKKLNFNSLENHKYGLYNSYIPNFFALITIAILLTIPSLAKLISLVFIGVTLRLFQSFSGLTSAINGVINSQVHIEKFYQMEQNKLTKEKQNFTIDTNSNKLVLQKVSFKYFNSESEIFNNLSIEFSKNAHTIITGQNGSGKSTLLGLLSNVYYPTSGKVISFSDKFAYIGANPLIFESTLYENLMYGNRLDIDINLLNEYLRKFEVFKEENNYDLEKQISNKSLSSGQMQKIAFIRALVSNADILLLDEATANLDKKSKRDVIDFVQNKGITIINSTHLEEELQNFDHHIEIQIKDETRTLNVLK